MEVAIDKCGITTVLSSRRFLSKAGIEPLDGTIYLEDVMPAFSHAARLRMFVTVLVLPAWASLDCMSSASREMHWRPSSFPAGALVLRRA